MLRHHDINSFILGKKGQYLAYCLIAVLVLLLFNSIINTYQAITLSHQDLEANKHSLQSKAQLNNATPIANSHLFGEYLAPQLDQNSLPKTMLNIQLVGVMLASPPKYSQVIISLPDGNEKILNLNNPLPGGAKIIRIMSNYIIIENNNKKEILSLPQNKLIFDKIPAGLEFEHE